MRKKLILASSSPRRQELLRLANISFNIRKAIVDESEIHSIDPVEKVKQLAELKGKSLSFQQDGEIILAADTIVAYNGRIFEKPKDEKEAYHMMSTFSGNSHDVYTGVLIRSSEKEVTFVEQTEVEFWPLTEEEIKWYISTDDPYDKAGGYGIQSLGSIFVKRIVGDYYNVMGLPISTVVRKVKDFQIYPEYK